MFNKNDWCKTCLKRLKIGIAPGFFFDPHEIHISYFSKEGGKYSSQILICGNGDKTYSSPKLKW